MRLQEDFYRRRFSIRSEIGMKIEAGSVKELGRDAPKPLDLVSNDIILFSLRSLGKVAVMASEEDEELVWITDCGPFIIVTDPLDGSRNIDASIPTGTISRIYNRLAELDHLPVQEKAQLNSLQSGTQLLVAGYVLYSSAIIMCISFGSGTHAFTLDRSTGEFVLMHPSIQTPPRDNLDLESPHQHSWFYLFLDRRCVAPLFHESSEFLLDSGIRCAIIFQTCPVRIE